MLRGNKTKSSSSIQTTGGSFQFTVIILQQVEDGIVIQKRFNGSMNFDFFYNEYKNGFGNLEGEFWLGLNKIHRLTSSSQFVLRVELEDWDGNTAFAEYDKFVIGDEKSKYNLVGLGRYKGMLTLPIIANSITGGADTIVQN